MRARVDIAVDRDPAEIVTAFVKPLDVLLRQRGVGTVIKHKAGPLFVAIDVQLSPGAALDHVLEFLANADAPVGSLVSRLNWLGQKRDIRILGPEASE
jgi:hypothetical protein